MLLQRSLKVPSPKSHSFLEFYHPHVPIVNLDHIEILEPLILWTVILISSQHHPELSYIFLRLKDAHQRLLERAVFANEGTYGTVQALLLLSIWPLPVKKQIWDPSWRYCNLALAIAQQLGLHEPNSQREYSTSPTSTELSVRTWTACVFVATTLAIDIGLPSPMESFFHDLAKTNSTEPVSTHIQIQQRILYHYHITAPADHFFCGAAIRTSIRDLEEIKAQKSDSWQIQTLLEFLGAKLRIHLHHLQLWSDAYGQKHLWTQMWYSTLEITLQISDTINRVLGSDVAESPDKSAMLMTIYALPKHYFYILAHSAFAILKFLALKCPASEVDREKARAGICSFYDYFQKLSETPDDEFSRIGRLLYFLARAERDQLLSIGTTAKTRSAASLVIDVVRARDLLRDRNVELHPPESGSVAQSDGQNLQVLASQSVGEATFSGDTADMQGMESWTEDYFDFLRAGASSSDWLRDQWLNELGLEYPFSASDMASF